MVMRIQLGTIVARFDHFSEDGDRVFFRDKDALERMGAELLDHSVNSWRRRVETYLADAGADLDFDDLADYNAHVMLQRFQFNQPPHVITLGSMVNDTELLGLQVDFDRLEMSFNWRHMVTNFLAEEERVKYLENTAKVILPTRSTTRSRLTRPLRCHSTVAWRTCASVSMPDA